MTFYSIVNPYPVILNQVGGGLNGGKVYIGVAGQDPQTNPVTVYWDTSGTIPAAQPLTTIGGYIWNAGTPAQVYGPTEYSIRVRDRLDVEIFYDPHVKGELSDFIASLSGNAGASLIGTSSGDTLQEVLNRYDARDVNTAHVADYLPITADFKAACQAAVDAIGAFGVVVIPAGDFTLSGRVSWSNKTVLFQCAGIGTTNITMTGTNPGFYCRHTNTTTTYCEYVGFKDVTFITAGNNAHIALDFGWNIINLVTRAYYQIDGVEFVVADPSATQSFKNTIKLTNAHAGSIEGYWVRGQQEGTVGNVLLYDGRCIANTLDDYHATYGDIAIKETWLEAVKIYHSGAGGWSPFSLVTGATSGATGRWLMAGSGTVYLSVESGQFAVGETITGGGGSGVITGIQQSAMGCEGLCIGRGEVVGYNQAHHSQPPDYLTGWQITKKIENLHFNCRNIGINVRRQFSLMVSGIEFIGSLGSVNVMMELSQMRELTIDGVVSDLPAASTTAIALSSIYGGTISGVTGVGNTGMLFRNFNVYDTVINGNSLAQCATSLAGEFINVPVFVPGGTVSETTTQVTGATIVNAGSGYAVNDLVVVYGGAESAGQTEYCAVLKVASVNGSGGITGISVQSGGRYVYQPSNPVSTGRPSTYPGSGATFNLTWGAAASFTWRGSQVLGNLTTGGDHDIAGTGTNSAPSAVAAGSSATFLTVTVTGAKVSDYVLECAPSAYLNGLRLLPVITAANTVTVYYWNATGGSITPPAHDIFVTVRRRT